MKETISIKEVQIEDVPKMIDHIATVRGETEFLLMNSQDPMVTLEQEEEFVRGLIASPKRCMLLAHYREKVVGIADFYGNTNSRIAHHGRIGISVRKDFWGKGIGTKMMRGLIEFARSIHVEIIYLEVHSENERAIALYKKLGFVEDGRFKNYIKIGDKYADTIHMALHL